MYIAIDLTLVIFEFYARIKDKFTVEMLELLNKQIMAFLNYEKQYEINITKCDFAFHY